MGSESDPKDGKVVAGSIFWAVIVYAVRLFFLSFFLSLLVVAAQPPNPPFLHPRPITPPGAGGGGKTNKARERPNSNPLWVCGKIRFSSYFVGFKRFYISERVSGGLYR